VADLDCGRLQKVSASTPFPIRAAAAILTMWAGVVSVLVGSPAACAEKYSLEDVSPHFSPETQIIWNIETNRLPKKVWSYRVLPRVFSAEVVSNALAMGGFRTGRNLNPQPGGFVIWDRAAEGDMHPDYFSVHTNTGSISFRRERHPAGTGETNSEALVERTWYYARQLGLDKTLLGPRREGRDISLVRRLDGIELFDSQALWIRYGGRGEILNFALSWPKLIAIAKRLVITNLTPYYIEGEYGKTPEVTGSPKTINAFAVLEAVANWGSTNCAVRLAAPLTDWDAYVQSGGKK
jgi:hypothetical protein